MRVYKKISGAPLGKLGLSYFQPLLAPSPFLPSQLFLNSNFHYNVKLKAEDCKFCEPIRQWEVRPAVQLRRIEEGGRPGDHPNLVAAIREPPVYSQPVFFKTTSRQF